MEAASAADGSRGSPAYPILQGQHPEYLAKQLAEVKSGARNNAIMKGFASALSEADMRNVAAFYTAKQAKPGFAKHKDQVSLGEKIWRSTRAWVASTPSTPRRSCSPSAAARARTARR